MPSGPCPECKHQVARSAASCPRCGNTQFTVGAPLEELITCPHDCRGGVTSWYDKYVSRRMRWADCRNCSGKGFVSVPYRADARDGLTPEEVRARLSRKNGEVKARARKLHEEVTAERDKYDAEENEKRYRYANKLCLTCGGKLGFFEKLGGEKCRRCR